MKIIISTEGQQIKPLEYNSDNFKKVNKIFNGLELDLPAAPYPGQSITLAKDGIVLSAAVYYVALNWYAKGNKIFKNDEEERIEYYVRLKDIEMTDALDEPLWQ